MLNLKESYLELKDKINLHNQYSLLNSKCPSCYSKNHFIDDCPLITYKNENNLMKVFHKNNIHHFQDRNYFRRPKTKKTNTNIVDSIQIQDFIDHIFKKYKNKMENFTNKSQIFYLYLKNFSL